MDLALIPEVLSESDSCSEGRLLSKQDSTLVYLFSASFWKRSGILGAQGRGERAYPQAAPPRRPVNGRDSARRAVITVVGVSSGVSPELTVSYTCEFILKRGQRPDSTAPGTQGSLRNVSVGAENHPGYNPHRVSQALTHVGSPPWVGKDCGSRVELPSTGEFRGLGFAQMVLRGCDNEEGQDRGPGLVFKSADD